MFVWRRLLPFNKTLVRYTRVRRQTLYRQTSDDVPSDLGHCTVKPQTLYPRQTATLYRQTSCRRRLCRGFQLIIAKQTGALSVNEDFAGCYSLTGRFTAS